MNSKFLLDFSYVLATLGNFVRGGLFIGVRRNASFFHSIAFVRTWHLYCYTYVWSQLQKKLLNIKNRTTNKSVGADHLSQHIVSTCFCIETIKVHLSLSITMFLTLSFYPLSSLVLSSPSLYLPQINISIYMYNLYI